MSYFNPFAKQQKLFKEAEEYKQLILYGRITASEVTAPNNMVQIDKEELDEVRRNMKPEDYQFE